MVEPGNEEQGEAGVALASRVMIRHRLRAEQAKLLARHVHYDHADA